MVWAYGAGEVDAELEIAGPLILRPVWTTTCDVRLQLLSQYSDQYKIDRFYSIESTL